MLDPPGYLGRSGGTSGFRSMVGTKTSERCGVAILVNSRDATDLDAVERLALDRCDPRNVST